MLMYLAPFLFSLLAWWSSTSVIIYVDGLPTGTVRWSLAVTSLLALAALCAMYGLRNETSLPSVYLAFVCGLLAWAWPEVGFYTGYLSGPRLSPCPENCGGWRHFRHAVHANLYHELAILLIGVVVTVLTWNAANPVGRWTFYALWGMSQSAKLNMFLGVRNLNVELLPPQLQHLRSYLTHKSINFLFPISITVSTLLTAGLYVQVFTAGDAAAATGLMLVATMLAIGVLEHWLLVLPISTTLLWEWGLRSRRNKRGNASIQTAGRDLPHHLAPAPAPLSAPDQF